MNTNPIPTQPETLLPCPFCGSHEQPTVFALNPDQYWVECSGYEGLCCKVFLSPTKEEAIRKWNTRRAAVTAPRGDVLNTLKLIATTLHEQIHNYRPVGDCLAFPCNKANAAIHAAGTTDNSQTDHQVSDQRVKLLLRYADHLSGCTSYTNGPCTCGFESAMQELADRGTAATSSPTPAERKSVVNLQAWTAISGWLRERPEATAAECLAELVRRIEVETIAPPKRTRVEGEQEKS